MEEHHSEDKISGSRRDDAEYKETEGETKLYYTKSLILRHPIMLSTQHWCDASHAQMKGMSLWVTPKVQ